MQHNSIENNDDETLNDYGSTRGRGYGPEMIERFRETRAAARASGHASAGRTDSLWRHVNGLSEALRALLVFVEYDGHVAPGDEQMQMLL